MINPAKLPEVEILAEQFIPDNVLFYINKGTMHCYDGNNTYTFKAGEYAIARKNRLARYTIENNEDGFQPFIFCFDEPFLKNFQEKHKIISPSFKSVSTFIKVKKTERIPNFINSLQSYSDHSGKIDTAFEDIKYEELLIILLQNEPELAGIFFDFRIPEKINLEKFMNHHFSFNVSINRFAFLTGRSLSAFKREFKTIFNETPNRWLVQKRLQEAYFLIDKSNKKPSDIYLDLGFESLSHFSFAFKRQYGVPPTQIIKS